MTDAPIRTSLRAARRLAVAKQHLVGPRPRRATPERIVECVRDLAYVQWDPVSVVAPSHLLSLWARLGPFRPGDLDRLLWKERRLLQHWIPFAGVVSVEDYPIFFSLMRRYPDSLSDSWGAQRARARAFLARHRALRTRVVSALRRGPLSLDQFPDHVRTKRAAPEWAPASAVSEMLGHLLMSGEAMVVGHEGNRNLWGHPDHYLPAAVRREPLSAESADRIAAERALRALGVATPREIHTYFVRGCYRNIRATLETLEADGRLRRVAVDGLPGRDPRFVHVDDLPRLDELERDELPPRVALLPPFDNMVYSPLRGKRLFGFDYVREQFLPPAKRRFGLWVLPILRGDEFVGRMDARLDKEGRRLEVVALYAEPGAPLTRAVGAEIQDEVDRLASFLGAESVVYPAQAPSGWIGGRRQWPVS